MNEKRPALAGKILVTVFFLMMVTVNALANILPINGRTTAAVSDAYPNLFAPAGLTFAIWGLIYLLLAAYVIAQLGVRAGSDDTGKARGLDQIGIWFIFSSLANTAWIFAWHYEIMPLSMLLTVVMLLCLAFIHGTSHKLELSTREKIWFRLPFSVYFGWLTVATIANATTLLVSLGWDGFGLADPVWMIVMLAAGLLIGLAVMLARRDIAYGLVFLWAYAGIVNKHLAASGFAGKYPKVVITTMICLAIFVLAEVYLLLNLKRTGKPAKG